MTKKMIRRNIEQVRTEQNTKAAKRISVQPNTFFRRQCRPNQKYYLYVLENAKKNVVLASRERG